MAIQHNIYKGVQRYTGLYTGIQEYTKVFRGITGVTSELGRPPVPALSPLTSFAIARQQNGTSYVGYISIKKFKNSVYGPWSDR